MMQATGILPADVAGVPRPTLERFTVDGRQGTHAG
jgi:hypothetical protein